MRPPISSYSSADGCRHGRRRTQLRGAVPGSLLSLGGATVGGGIATGQGAVRVGAAPRASCWIRRLRAGCMSIRCSSGQRHGPRRADRRAGQPVQSWSARTKLHAAGAGAGAGDSATAALRDRHVAGWPAAAGGRLWDCDRVGCRHSLLNTEGDLLEASIVGRTDVDQERPRPSIRSSSCRADAAACKRASPRTVRRCTPAPNCISAPLS